MNPLPEMVFLSEIVLQIKIAQRAADRLEVDADPIEVWGSIQSILGSAGIVSKILWPPGKKQKYQQRGKKLCLLLNIEQDNLLSDRTFRNFLEHYDEQIQDWFEEKPTVVYKDREITPFKSIWGNDIPTNSHRAYDPLKMTLTFRGKTLELRVVLDALEEVLEKCRPRTLT